MFAAKKGLVLILSLAVTAAALFLIDRKPPQPAVARRFLDELERSAELCDAHKRAFRNVLDGVAQTLGEFKDTSAGIEDILIHNYGFKPETMQAKKKSRNLSPNSLQAEVVRGKPTLLN